jgi:hypothetical protein
VRGWRGRKKRKVKGQNGVKKKRREKWMEDE